MMRGKFHPPNKRGFTLLEVLVATFILALVALPLLNMFVYSADINSRAGLKTKSTYDTKALMETLYTKTYADLLSSRQSYVYDGVTKKYVSITVEPAAAFDGLVTSGTPCYMHLLLKGTSATVTGPDGQSYTGAMSSFTLSVGSGTYSVKFGTTTRLNGTTDGRTIILYINAGPTAITSAVAIDADSAPYVLYARSADTITVTTSSINKREYKNGTPPDKVLMDVTCLIYPNNITSTPESVVQDTFKVAVP